MRASASARGRLVEPHGACSARPSAVRSRMKSAGLAHVGELLELVAHRVAELARCRCRASGRPSCGTMAKASGSGVCATSAPRMLNVQATACGSDITSASARSVAISARMRVELGAGVFAGEAEVVQRHRAERRRRPVGPDRVDRVGLDRRRASRRRWRRRAPAAPRRRRCAARGRSRAWRRLRQVGLEPLLGRRLGAGARSRTPPRRPASRACSV